ncbi:MAG: cobalamin biosynthesis protein CbiG [Alphaproteobacteria bacterium]|nr:cobalamin biosynthesis protein CbiG [Alphaproteobacteria bacterium]
MSLFDRVVIVDWSAASRPTLGRDSIWIGALDAAAWRIDWLENLPTRAAATASLADRLAAWRAAGQRVLVGFDFPLGYPRGVAAALGLAPRWRAVWDLLRDGLADGADNGCDRFGFAAALNRRMGTPGFPFWGTDRHPRPGLSARKPRPHGSSDVPERRFCERRVPKAQSCWKLAYVGAVGSQALTGIPRVSALRDDPRLAPDARIWPYETGLRELDRASAPPLLLAEVYPSLVPHYELPGRPKDAGQVCAAAAALAAADAAGAIGALFAGDPALARAERLAVEREEAWILGVADRPRLDPAPRRPRLPRAAAALGSRGPKRSES